MSEKESDIRVLEFLVSRLNDPDKWERNRYAIVYTAPKNVRFQIHEKRYIYGGVEKGVMVKEDQMIVRDIGLSWWPWAKRNRLFRKIIRHFKQLDQNARTQECKNRNKQLNDLLNKIEPPYIKKWNKKLKKAKVG